MSARTKVPLKAYVIPFIALIFFLVAWQVSLNAVMSGWRITEGPFEDGSFVVESPGGQTLTACLKYARCYYDEPETFSAGAP